MTDEDQEDIPASVSYFRPENIAAMSAIIATIATVVSLAVSWFQWLELRKTNELSAKQTSLSEQSLMVARGSLGDSRDANRHQLRAYMILERTFSENKHPADETIANFAVFKATNVGATPAKDVEFWAEVFFAEKPLKKSILTSINSKKPDGFGLAIGANKEIVFPADFNRQNFDQDIDQYKSGKYALVTVGKLIYKDIFGNSYSTEHCTYTDYSTRNRFSLCSFGNNFE